MADGVGGGASGAHLPSPTTGRGPSPSSSLDGAHLLRLLQNSPAPNSPASHTHGLPATAPGPHLFVDPAVAAMGPISSFPPLPQVPHLSDQQQQHPLLFHPSPGGGPHHLPLGPSHQQGPMPMWPPPLLPHQFLHPQQLPDLAVSFGFQSGNFRGDEHQNHQILGMVRDDSINNQKPIPKPTTAPPGFGKPMQTPVGAREAFGKMPQREQQQIQHHQQQQNQSNVRDLRRGGEQAALGRQWQPKGPATRRDERGKVEENHAGGFVEGGTKVEARKLERSYQKSEVGFAKAPGGEDGNAEEEKEEVVTEQFEESMVLQDGEDEAKNGVAKKGSSRNKDFRSDFSRGHHVSSQRIRIQRRSLRCRVDIDRLNSSLLSIFESLVPAEEKLAKQKQLLTSLSKLINKEWPDAKLYLYGSCANSFGVSNSDVDICLAVAGDEICKTDILLKLADVLEAGNLQNVQALTRARVPIAKLMDADTGLSCDICINNLLAVVNTKLLKDYATIDKRLRQLAFIVKHWARSRRVNETYQGTLSSYAYVIMCIHLLQQRRPAILPCLQAMEATYLVSVDNTEYSYFDQVEKLQNFGARNKESLARLVWAFFHYWAYQHDYTADVISIRTGSIISKEAKDWTRRIGNDRHLICIEDPFEISHDLGRVVDRYSIKILREEFERAANILQYDPNPLVALFEPYVPPSKGITNARGDGEQL